MDADAAQFRPRSVVEPNPERAFGQNFSDAFRPFEEHKVARPAQDLPESEPGKLPRVLEAVCVHVEDILEPGLPEGAGRGVTATAEGLHVARDPVVVCLQRRPRLAEVDAKLDSMRAQTAQVPGFMPEANVQLATAALVQRLENAGLNVVGRRPGS